MASKKQISEIAATLGRTWRLGQIEGKSGCFPEEREIGRAAAKGQTMRAALYVRISTINHGQDTDVQLRELREYCERRGWEITSEYVDTGISGAKEKRPELDKLIANAKRRKFDAVVVYRYDRFARSLRHLVNALEDFRALGIDFVSLHEGVDTSTPNGRLVFGIFASIAEFERELIRDRVRSGIRNARAKGRPIGRPRLNLNRSEIARLRAQGLSWRAIGRSLGVSEGSVRRLATAAA